MEVLDERGRRAKDGGRGTRKRRRRSGRSRSESPQAREAVARKKRRKAGKKTDKSRSPQGSDSGSSSSSSSEESEDSSSSSDSSAVSSDSGKGHREGKKKAKQGKWGILNDIWPLERRPRKLQDRKYVEQLSWGTLSALQDRYEKEAERKGVGAAIFGKDQKLRKTTFKKKADDGVARLHPARFLRLPLAAPSRYWKKVPKCHDQRFRHVQLGHYGAESQINEKVILAMHDRQVRNGTVRLGCLRFRWYRIAGGRIYFMIIQAG